MSHQIVIHLVEKYFVLKDLIIHMENEKKIQLERGEETTSTNMTMVVFGSFDPIPLPSLLCKMEVILDAIDSSKHLSLGTLSIQLKRFA